MFPILLGDGLRGGSRMRNTPRGSSRIRGHLPRGTPSPHATPPSHGSRRTAARSPTEAPSRSRICGLATAGARSYPRDAVRAPLAEATSGEPHAREFSVNMQSAIENAGGGRRGGGRLEGETATDARAVLAALLSRRATILAWCSLLSVGCALPPAPGSLSGLQDGGATVPFSSFPTEYLRAFCSHFANCLNYRRDFLRTRLILGAAGCDSLVARYGGYAFGYGLNAFITGVQRGLIRYDEAAARVCLRDYATTCQVDQEFPDFARVCGKVFSGTLASGQPCASSAECAPNLWCSSIGATSDCTGTCQQRLPPGAACSFPQECLQPATGWAECRVTCHDVRYDAPAVLGQPCGFIDDDGATRGRLVPCARGLWCAVSSGVPTCQPAAAANQPCAGACVDGQACVFNGTENRCTPFRLQTGEGAACTRDDQPCDFTNLLQCVSDQDGGVSVCRRRIRGDGRVGASCDSIGDCRSGLSCVSGSCSDGRSMRVPCSSPNECSSGACLAGWCVAPGCGR